MDDLKVRLRGTRRSYSVFGFAFILLIAVALVATRITVQLPQLLRCNWLQEQSWWTWVSSFVPMYLFAFPASFLFLRLLPGKAPEDRSLTGKQFWTLLPICFCLMYAGSLAGSFLSMVLSGGQAVNALDSYALDQSPLKILFMVILAPLLEELLCRKMLVDRTVRYGEKLSVLMSGLLFGLLHQNLFQFFYAFALGSLFAYVYIRTGRVRYTVLLHAIVNFIGSVVGPAVLSLVDMDLVNEISEGTASLEQMIEAAPGLLVLMSYTMTLMGMAVFGLVLLIIKARRLVWKEAEQQLPGKTALKAALVNVGMILYVLLCLATMALALFIK